MYKNITQDFVADFCENTTSTLQHLNSKIEIMNDHIKALELKNEKFENLVYQISIINEKVVSAEQKVNDLNKIMMKHFAYKGLQQPVLHPNLEVINPLKLPLNSTQTLLQNPFQFNTSK